MDVRNSGVSNLPGTGNVGRAENGSTEVKSFNEWWQGIKQAVINFFSFSKKDSTSEVPSHDLSQREGRVSSEGELEANRSRGANEISETRENAQPISQNLQTSQNSEVQQASEAAQTQETSQASGAQEIDPCQLFADEEKKRLDENVSPKNLKYYGDILEQICEKAINQVKAGKPKNSGKYESFGSEDVKALQKALQKADEMTTELNNLKTELNNIKESYVSADKEKFVSSCGAMKKAVTSFLKEHCPEKKFDQLYPQVLNQQKSAWKPISKDLTITNENNEKTTGKCSLKPANEQGWFSYLTNPNSDPQPNDAEYGISSMDRKSKHLINTWETSISNENGTVLFSAIRHGCVANRKDAPMELLAACAQKKISELGNGSELGKDNNHPIEITMSNIQLMTAGPIGDGDLPKKQMDALNKLKDQPQPVALKVPYPDGSETIYVKVNPPLVFNFGTNMQEYHTVIGRFSKELKQDNENSLKMMLGNLESLASLDISNPYKLGEYCDRNSNSFLVKFLRRECQDFKQGDIVLQLAKQVADIWVNEKYKDGKDPYAMQSRLAVLSYNLGLSTTFNCKSGKDRTGIMNAECNHLALQIESSGVVPEPYKDLSAQQKLNLSRSLDASGASHVTQACTGIQGLKIIDSLGGIFKFTGVANRFGEVKGGSSAAR